MSQSLAKNTFLLVSFQLLTKMLSSFWVFYIARRLGTESYGAWANALAVAAIFGTLQDLGTFSVYVKDVSQDPDRTRPYFGTALTLYPVLCVVILVLLGVFGGLLHYPGRMTALLILAGLSLFSLSFGYASQVVLHAHQDFRTYVLGALCGTLVYLAVGTALVATGHGAAGALAALAVGNLFTSFLLVRWTTARYGRPEFRWEPVRLGKEIALGLPLMASGFMYELVVRSDRILIDKFLGAAAVGLFQAAFFLAYTPKDLLLNPLINAVYPRLASAFAQDRSALSDMLERLT